MSRLRSALEMEDRVMAEILIIVSCSSANSFILSMAGIDAEDVCVDLIRYLLAAFVASSQCSAPGAIYRRTR